MFKYSNELKLKFIKYYLEEHHSYSECCKNLILQVVNQFWRMDSSSLFVIGNLIREMIEIYNPDFETKEYNSSDIKQIFILTHNVSFHQDVTFGYDKPEHFKYASFFEIKL